MARKPKAAAQPLPAPATQRPVIAGRVPQELYEKIRVSAEASGRSMSEELAWLASEAFTWREAHQTSQTMLAEIRGVSDRNLEAALRKRGYLPVALYPRGKAWISPDADRKKLNLVIDVKRLIADMLPGLETVLHEALGGLAKTEDKK